MMLLKRVYVTDYHEFAPLEEHLRTLIDQSIRIQEVGTIDGQYVGIVSNSETPKDGLAHFVDRVKGECNG